MRSIVRVGVSEVTTLSSVYSTPPLIDTINCTKARAFDGTFLILKKRGAP